MKHATNTFSAEHLKQSPPDKKSGSSSRTHYAVILLLLVVAYLISSWMAATPDTFSIQLGSGFAMFWLGGGLTTLILLTFFAKR